LEEKYPARRINLGSVKKSWKKHLHFLRETSSRKIVVHFWKIYFHHFGKINHSRKNKKPWEIILKVKFCHLRIQVKKTWSWTWALGETVEFRPVLVRVIGDIYFFRGRTNFSHFRGTFKSQKALSFTGASISAR